MATTDPVSPNTARQLSSNGHRQMIGWLGLLMPFLVWALAEIRPMAALPPTVSIDSLSAYYYTGGVAVFVGVLIALSLFLFTYQGYSNDRADRVIGKIGCVAAIGVAVFPTTAPVESLTLDWWSPMMTKIHYGSAVVLFGTFILFSLWLFRKTGKPKDAPRATGKRRRDWIFVSCGVTMIGAMAWAAYCGANRRSIFWPEAVAIAAFAISWLAKGEVYAISSTAKAFLHAD